MFTDVHFAAAMRKEQSAGQASDRADLFSAGMLITAPGGHGTEYPIKVVTLSDPSEAQAFVDARIAEGSDYIKLVLDDGYAYGGHQPTLIRETVAPAIAAAHRRGKLAVAHIGTLQEAEDAINAGTDGLAHLFVGAKSDPDFGRLAASHHAFDPNAHDLAARQFEEGLHVSQQAELRRFCRGRKAIGGCRRADSGG